MLKSAMIDFAAVTDVGGVRRRKPGLAGLPIRNWGCSWSLTGLAAMRPELSRRNWWSISCHGWCAARLSQGRMGRSHPALTPRPLSQRKRGTRSRQVGNLSYRPGELCLAIAEQVKVLSDLVYKETRGQPGINGTGTTVVLALVESAQATIVHAGDSRAYLFRRGQLRQVTQDHTLGQLLVRNRELSESAVDTTARCAEADAVHRHARARLRRTRKRSILSRPTCCCCAATVCMGKSTTAKSAGFCGPA